MWRELLAFLASLAAEPAVIDSEPPRAAASVHVARSSMEKDSPTPQPDPDEGECCKDCKGTGKIVHADGHQTDCPCPKDCECKAGKDAVLDPPLVPVDPKTLTRRSGRIVCQGGTCYWVDEVTGQQYRIVK